MKNDHPLEPRSGKNNDQQRNTNDRSREHTLDRSLEDVLRDSSADWSELRDAIKAQGGINRALAGATGVLMGGDDEDQLRWQEERAVSTEESMLFTMMMPTVAEEGHSRRYRSSRRISSSLRSSDSTKSSRRLIMRGSSFGSVNIMDFGVDNTLNDEPSEDGCKDTYSGVFSISKSTDSLASGVGFVGWEDGGKGSESGSGAVLSIGERKDSLASFSGFVGWGEGDSDSDSDSDNDNEGDNHNVDHNGKADDDGSVDTAALSKNEGNSSLANNTLSSLGHLCDSTGFLHWDHTLQSRNKATNVNEEFPAADNVKDKRDRLLGDGGQEFVIEIEKKYRSGRESQNNNDASWKSLEHLDLHADVTSTINSNKIPKRDVRRRATDAGADAYACRRKYGGNDRTATTILLDEILQDNCDSGSSNKSSTTTANTVVSGGGGGIIAREGRTCKETKDSSSSLLNVREKIRLRNRGGNGSDNETDWRKSFHIEDYDPPPEHLEFELDVSISSIIKDNLGGSEHSCNSGFLRCPRRQPRRHTTGPFADRFAAAPAAATGGLWNMVGRRRLTCDSEDMAEACRKKFDGNAAVPDKFDLEGIRKALLSGIVQDNTSSTTTTTTGVIGGGTAGAGTNTKEPSSSAAHPRHKRPSFQIPCTNHLTKGNYFEKPQCGYVWQSPLPVTQLVRQASDKTNRSTNTNSYMNLHPRKSSGSGIIRMKQESDGNVNEEDVDIYTHRNRLYGKLL